MSKSRGPDWTPSTTAGLPEQKQQSRLDSLDKSRSPQTGEFCKESGRDRFGVRGRRMLTGFCKGAEDVDRVSAKGAEDVEKFV